MNFEEKVSAQIAQVAAFADFLPAVAIINRATDGAAIWMNKRGLSQLGIELSDLQKFQDKEYFERFFNFADSEDINPKILALFERNNDEEVVTFFQQVKIAGKLDWTWHMSSTKILFRDDQGAPFLMLTLSIPLDRMFLAQKAEKLLHENNFLKENMLAFSSLSLREKEVLKRLALGETASECGDKLFISPQTVETHRKNIKKKLGVNTFFELNTFARAFDLICLYLTSTLGTSIWLDGALSY